MRLSKADRAIVAEITNQPALTRRVHLQGIGDQDAIESERIQPGVVRLYNYGYGAEVMSVTEKGLMVEIEVRDTKTDKRHVERKRRGTLVPISNRPEYWLNQSKEGNP